MARNLTFFSIAVLAAVVSICHAAITPEDYWNFMLPNTPMPNSIRERLQPDGVGVNTGHGNSHVNVSKGGVNENTGHKGKPVVATVSANFKNYATSEDHHASANFNKNYAASEDDTMSANFNKNYAASEDEHGSANFKNYAASEDQHVSANFKNYAAAEVLLHDDPNVTLFFLEKDLHPGTKLNMFFPKATKSPKFLPRSEANKIPFSSSKFPEILKQVSVERDSQEAQSMMETIKECEEPAIKGEAKQCVTSLESMVDFARSKLGTRVKALATEVKKETMKQQYIIALAVHKLARTKSVACHSENYVYVVYYCHELSDTSTYVVPLVGEDKTRVDAVAVCHKDTSQWNPKHVAFKVLKVKPGSVPICHFILEDHIVWVQN